MYTERAWSFQAVGWYTVQTSSVFGRWWFSRGCWYTLCWGGGHEDVHATVTTGLRYHSLCHAWGSGHAGSFLISPPCLHVRSAICTFWLKCFMLAICMHLLNTSWNVCLCAGEWPDSKVGSWWPICCEESWTISWHLSKTWTSHCYFWQSSPKVYCKCEFCAHDPCRIWT